jgi:hypothetical protein
MAGTEVFKEDDVGGTIGCVRLALGVGMKEEGEELFTRGSYIPS